MILADWGEKVCPGTFGKIQLGSREYPQSPSIKKQSTKAVTPLVPTPFAPLRRRNIVRDATSTTILLLLVLLLLLSLLLLLLLLHLFLKTEKQHCP